MVQCELCMSCQPCPPPRSHTRSHMESNPKLSGTLPTEFGALTALRVSVKFTGTSLSGTLPKELGNLSKLFENLIFTSTSISGFIPTQLGKLSNFKMGLLLGGMLLSGTVPTQLGMLSSYDNHLLLSNNKLSGFIPTQFGHLTGRLRVVADAPDTRGNFMSGYIPSELGRLTGLQRLMMETTLFKNQFSGTIPSELGELTSFAGYLRLTGNPLSGFIPTQLGRMKDSTWALELQSTSISGSLPTTLGAMTKLRGHLIMSSTRLSGVIPTQFGALTALYQTMHLQSTSLSGTVPSELGRMNSLKTDIVMSGLRLSGSLPSQLGLLQKLGYAHALDLRSNSLSGFLPNEVTSPRKPSFCLSLDTDEVYCPILPLSTSTIISESGCFYSSCQPPTYIPPHGSLPVEAVTASAVNTDSPAALCSDGPPSFSAVACALLAATSPWIQLNLYRSTPIHKVVIYNRLDCCQGDLGLHEIWVSNSPAQDYTDVSQRCFVGTASSTSGPFVEDCWAYGQFVRLVLPGSSRTLHLVEVVISARRAIMGTNESAVLNATAEVPELSSLALVEGVTATLNGDEAAATACIDGNRSNGCESGVASLNPQLILSLAEARD